MTGKLRIARGVLCVTSAAFTGIALVSFDQGDWGSFWGVRNLCGPVGAVLAGSLRIAFGSVMSWFFPFFLIYWGVQSFRGRTLRENGRRIICTFVFLWILSAILVAGGRGESGGLIGIRTVSLLELISGRIGSILILACSLLLISIVLFFGSVKTFLGVLRRIPFPRLFSIRGRPVRRKRPVGPKVEVGSSPKVHTTPAVEKKPQPVKIAVPESKGRKPEPRVPVTHLPLTGGASQGAESTPPPEISLLDDYSESKVPYSREDLITRSEIIEAKLRDYGLDGKVQEVRPGPVVTTFEFVPAPGVKVSQIASRSDDISLALAARAIRIQAPIPGRGAVGIEVPNPEPKIVPLRGLLEHYPTEKDGLHIALGETVTGEPYFADLAAMPHLLIAGATGSGKSVCINSIICSLLFHHTPLTCRFILVDPKRLELITYNGIPHLLHPVITEAAPALKILQWLTLEMDRRYKLLAASGVKNIQGFNRKVEGKGITPQESSEVVEKLPYYVTIIDELADIMVIMGNEIYPPITRLSQMARAVGIHLVFATQRPSVDIVTGLIKANFPSRIAFQVTSKTDSRTILDINGAEKLLGNGDMLYLPKNLPAPIRIQGAFISEAEAERVAEYWHGFHDGTEELDLSGREADSMFDDAVIDDELFNKAKELVIIHQQGSISLIQRRLRVGYARAARLIDMLEQSGIVGPFEGSKARQVLVSREEYEGN